MQARDAIIVATEENLIVWICVVSDHDTAARGVDDMAAVGMRVNAVAQIPTEAYGMLKLE